MAISTLALSAFAYRDARDELPCAPLPLCLTSHLPQASTCHAHFILLPCVPSPPVSVATFWSSFWILISFTRYICVYRPSPSLSLCICSLSLSLSVFVLLLYVFSVLICLSVVRLLSPCHALAQLQATGYGYGFGFGLRSQSSDRRANFL